jgi:SPP1 gp7 family putative phage head morphogenesis protein
MTWAVSAEVDRFDEALEWFLSRTVISAAEKDRIFAAAKARAFWISGAAQLDVVQDVFDDIGRSLDNGEPYELFRNRVRDKLAVQWGRDNPARVETIFRNAAQSSYNAGRYQQSTEPAVLELRPYWMFDAVLDQRTTPTICRPRDSTILPADHPWWQKNYPPLHHRCRAGVRNLRESEAKRRGISSGPPEADEPGTGWGAAPIGAAAEWRPSPDGKDPGLFEILTDKEPD